MAAGSVYTHSGLGPYVEGNRLLEGYSTLGHIIGVRAKESGECCTNCKDPIDGYYLRLIIWPEKEGERSPEVMFCASCVIKHAKPTNEILKSYEYSEEARKELYRGRMRIQNEAAEYVCDIHFQSQLNDLRKDNDSIYVEISPVDRILRENIATSPKKLESHYCPIMTFAAGGLSRCTREPRWWIRVWEANPE